MVGSKDAGVSRVMSLGISSRWYPSASLAAIFAIGNPVAFDASADDRDTRGFISMTMIRPFAGIDRELDVGAAGLDADPADDAAPEIAHPLILAIGQRQRRRDGDAVAGVHAHRIDVLDRADHDKVVGLVAHHLELEFLPADHRLFEQDLVDGAHLDARGRPARGTLRCCRRCRRRRRPA